MPIALSPPLPVLRDPSPDEIRALLARGPVVVVATDTALVSTLLASGGTHGWALLPAEASGGAIDAAARAAEAGLVVLPAALASTVTPVAAATRPRDTVPADDTAVERLTTRERDVLQLVAQGLHNRAIASALGISDHTVKFHLASIFGKLGASTRTEAARVGLRRGLVQI